MPRGDGTGPMGMGSMTGRGTGFCAGVAKLTRGSVRFGCRRGFRRMFNDTVLSRSARFSDNEKELLSKQAKFLENQLQQVKKLILSFNKEAE